MIFLVEKHYFIHCSPTDLSSVDIEDVEKRGVIASMFAEVLDCCLVTYLNLKDLISAICSAVPLVSRCSSMISRASLS